MLLHSIQKSYKGSDIDLVKLREGAVLHWYKDTLDNWTGGYGHLRVKGDPERFGQAEADAWLIVDITKARRAADKQFAKLPYQTQMLYEVLVSCNYQLGNLEAKFPNSFKALVDGDYPTALRGFENSLWARQTPTRVKDLTAALRHTIDCYTQYKNVA